jgi:hypothetical protein
MRELKLGIRCHTFRATGMTDHPINGGGIEAAQCVAAQSNAKATGLYRLGNDAVSVGEVEKIGIS